MERKYAQRIKRKCSVNEYKDKLSREKWKLHKRTK